MLHDCELAELKRPGTRHTLLQPAAHTGTPLRGRGSKGKPKQEGEEKKSSAGGDKMISSTPAALRSRPTPRAPLRAATLQPQPQPLGPHAELLVHYTRITERGGEGVPLGIKPLDRKLKHTCLIATVSSALAALAALCGHPLQRASEAPAALASGNAKGNASLEAPRPKA